jgi:quercetin dioxygenase-like cupin family protein
VRLPVVIVASVVASTSLGLSARGVSARAWTNGQEKDTGVVRVLDNARVRAYRTTAEARATVEHGPAVLVSLEDSAAGKAGSAVWVDDAAAKNLAADVRGPIAIVQPRRSPPAAQPPDGSKPGDAPFSGMSFTPMFENDRVAVIRARMEVGAREGFHTHASDTVVIHLSGGEIEDMANGKTVVNRWKKGDIEFEARGSSHSARNVGGAVDVVLVTLKPD